MADASVAEAYTSYSLSRYSSPPGAKVTDAYKDVYQQFQETEHTEVLHSALVQTQAETFNVNSDPVEYSDPTENISGPVCAYEQEVVLDSEDEEMLDNKVVTVAKGLWDEPPSLSKQAEERAANTSAPSFGKSVTAHHMLEGDKEASVDAEGSDDKHHPHLSTTLNEILSPETEELAETNALGYVDRYLSSTNVDLSQRIFYRKATREKSPPVMSARGARNLAKKIQVRIHHDEKRPFEWADSGQIDRGAGIFFKKIEASRNSKFCGQTYTRRQKKSGYSENQGNFITCNRCEEKLAQGPRTVAENNNSIKEWDVQSDAARENVEAYSGVTHTEDMSDIGLDTQIAAEAMEALAYVPSPESRWTKIKDQPSKPRNMNSSVLEGSVVRCNRRRNGLEAYPFKLVGEAKYLRLPSSSFGVARKCRLNSQVQASPQISASSSFSRLNSLHYPKGPRGKRKYNLQSHPDAPRNRCAQSFIVNGNEGDTHSAKSPRSQRGPEGRDDVNESCFPHTHQLYNAKCIKIGTISEGRKVSSASVTCYKHHKKPSDKNLPKSSLLKELIRLGVSESMPDLTGKDLRQRRDMSYVQVLFSQHLDESIIKQQKKILARMNISVASSSMEATHFVADKFTRTQNMLETMALGKLVVTHLWLESCGQANCFIDEKNYILRDVKKEKEMGFSMPVSLARARQHPLLNGKRVFITPSIKPGKKVITSLVAAVHGQAVDECQIYAGKNKILDDLLILSCEEDYAVCQPFIERGIAVYGSELLLSGIVTQKLEFERHQLFANHVAMNNPATYCRRFRKVYRRRRDLYL